MIVLRLSVVVAICSGLVGRAWADESPTFERDVRPIFKTYCLGCHGAGEKLEGDLDLRLKRFAARGGISGPAIEPGEPDASYLLMRIQDGEMPPGEKKVPPEQVAVIERWIAGGAVTLREEPDSLPPGIDITPEERAFWAFQPIRRTGAAILQARGSRPDADRRLHRGEAPRAWALVRPGGRPPHPHPPRQRRPDGTAAHPRGDRRLPRRPGARRLRADDRPPARLAALRRALGAALARRRRLCRLRRQRQRGHAEALRVQVSRLRHPGLQRATCRSIGSSSSNWPATSWSRVPGRT